MGKTSTKGEDYETTLRRLQLALVETQVRAMAEGWKVLVVLEGRDAAGKDGTIKRLTEHLSARNTRVVALPKPSDRERSSWYLQRYVAQLPAGGELVIMNRSWYNRAGVETVMGFSTPEEQAIFRREAPAFEQMLIESGVRLVKYWLDISKDEQADRLDKRRSDPLKQMKVSPLDAVAQEKWEAYSRARDEMLLATHTEAAPWWCVSTDHKKRARLNLMRHLLGQLGAPDIEAPDAEVLFRFEPAAIEDGRLAP
jgi:polyphosphate kinase 2